MISITTKLKFSCQFFLETIVAHFGVKFCSAEACSKILYDLSVVCLPSNFRCRIGLTQNNRLFLPPFHHSNNRYAADLPRPNSGNFFRGKNCTECCLPWCRPKMPATNFFRHLKQNKSAKMHCSF